MRSGLLMAVGVVVFAIGTLPTAAGPDGAGSAKAVEASPPRGWAARHPGHVEQRGGELHAARASQGARGTNHLYAGRAAGARRSARQEPHRCRRLDRARRCRVLCAVLVRLVLAQAARRRLAGARRGAQGWTHAGDDARGAQDGRLHARAPARRRRDHGGRRSMRVTRRAGDDDADRLQQRQAHRADARIRPHLQRDDPQRAHHPARRPAARQRARSISGRATLAAAGKATRWSSSRPTSRRSTTCDRRTAARGRARNGGWSSA